MIVPKLVAVTKADWRMLSHNTRQPYSIHPSIPAEVTMDEAPKSYAIRMKEARAQARPKR